MPHSCATWLSISAVVLDCSAVVVEIWLFGCSEVPFAGTVHKRLWLPLRKCLQTKFHKEYQN